MADDYGCFGSDTPEQQRAHDAVHDEYEDGEYWVERGALVENEPYNVMDISPHDGAGVAGYWVEKFASTATRKPQRRTTCSDHTPLQAHTAREQAPCVPATQVSAASPAATRR
eukprot:COSAG06_NODE_28473_length_573_cov_2.571730_1_plen_113_part_00